MLNLVYTHHLEGDAVSEQDLRSVLGRKELPKWYTYINYLQDSNLITMTDKDDYVLKKDLGNMTLWDFYRTLPYPLPIKDELDEMKSELQKPWLGLLVNRFSNTEACAKEQLNLPLAAIFAKSEPRQKIADSTDSAKHPDSDKLFKNSTDKQAANRKKNNATPDFEPAAYDKDSEVECDNYDREIIIPDGDNGVNNKPESASHENKNRRNIITEADNPQSTTE